jgi:lipopolysaccharide transport system permease protein
MTGFQCTGSPSSARVTSLRVIEPPLGFNLPSVREIWEHRDLLYFLVRRDVAVRYKQSAIGVLWAVLQPLLLAVVFSVFFGLLAKVPSQSHIPYPLFAVSGMVLWLFFSATLTTSATSTVQSAELISKVYFPRVLIPLAAALAPLVDLAVALLVVLGAMLIYGVTPNVQVVLLPLVVGLSVTTAFGLGMLLSAMNVKYRDVHLTVPFLILVGMFITPITYPIRLIPHAYQALYSVNPMVGVLETYRWMLFPHTPFPTTAFLMSLAVSVVLLLGGALYFKRAERDFADVI